MGHHAVAALTRAIRLADAQGVRQVLERLGNALVHVPRQDTGRVALGTALCVAGVSTQTLDELLEAGADPNRAFRDNRSTPLHLALARPGPQGALQVSVLLRYGADPEYPNKQGIPAIENARTEGRHELVEIMRAPERHRQIAGRAPTPRETDPDPAQPGL